MVRKGFAAYKRSTLWSLAWRRCSNMVYYHNSYVPLTKPWYRSNEVSQRRVQWPTLWTVTCTISMCTWEAHNRGECFGGKSSVVIVTDHPGKAPSNILQLLLPMQKLHILCMRHNSSKSHKLPHWHHTGGEEATAWGIYVPPMLEYRCNSAIKFSPTHLTTVQRKQKDGTRISVKVRHSTTSMSTRVEFFKGV